VVPSFGAIGEGKPWYEACIWVGWGWAARLVDRLPGTGTSEFTVKGLGEIYVVLFIIVDCVLVYVKQQFFTEECAGTVGSRPGGLDVGLVGRPGPTAAETRFLVGEFFNLR
jgi:hypothetical protein